MKIQRSELEIHQVGQFRRE